MIPNKLEIKRKYLGMEQNVVEKFNEGIQRFKKKQHVIFNIQLIKIPCIAKNALFYVTGCSKSKILPVTCQYNALESIILTIHVERREKNYLEKKIRSIFTFFFYNIQIHLPT